MSIQEKERLITHLGYAIKKDSISDEEYKSIRKDLTVAPAGSTRFAPVGDSFPVFYESPKRIFVPRAWGIEKYGEVDNILVAGTPLRPELKFVGNAYDYQTDIINKFVSNPNGLICVPCGRGKTFMAIAIAARLGHKFLIIVDKEFLLQQWSGELNSLMPGIRIGIIQGDLKQINNIQEPVQTIAQLKESLKALKLPVGGTKDVLKERLDKAQGPKEPVQYDCCIAMIQTLVQKDFAETDFRSFGLGIFDECHHLGAAHFSKSLLKVQTKYMLGLSATPTRDDGLTKVFEWFIGKPIYWEKTREADPDVIVRKVAFECDDETYNTEPCNHMGEVILATLLTHIVECEERNKKIDEILASLVKDSKRKILVLSERKSHLERIAAGLPKDTKAGYYIGGMNEDVRETGAKECQVLLGTYAMASEAMNIKTLNTMIMASPRKKIEQSTGRILRTRKDERDVKPLIIDIVDNHAVYKNQWLKRKAYYKRCAYVLEGSSVKEQEPPSTTVCLIQDD